MSEMSGRDKGGRFTVGNKAGPGNPFARQMVEMRKAIASEVSAQDMRDIAMTLRARAITGNLEAAKILFLYAAGKPGPCPDPDTLDAHELAVRRQNTATPEDMKGLFESMPAGLLCAIAQAVAP